MAMQSPQYHGAGLTEKGYGADVPDATYASKAHLGLSPANRTEGPSFGSISVMVASGADRLMQLAGLAEAIADRYVGAEPSNQSSGEGAAPCNGLVDALDQHLRASIRSLDRIEYHLSRLQRSLP